MAKSGKKTIEELRREQADKVMSAKDMDGVKGGKATPRRSFIHTLVRTILPQ